MIVADDDKNPTLLGIRVAGEGASAVIEAASLLIHENSPCTRLETVLHPHPSITEAVLVCEKENVLFYCKVHSAAYPPFPRAPCTLLSMQALTTASILLPTSSPPPPPP